MKFCLPLLLASSVMLSSCATEILPSRSAVAISAKESFVQNRHGICWPGEFNRTPITPLPLAGPNDGEFTAGYHNHVRPGQSCHTQESFVYSGAFRFNLSGLENKVITSAILRLDRRNTEIPIHVTRNVSSGILNEDRCQLLLEVVTEDWPLESTGTFSSRSIPNLVPINITQENSLTAIGIDVKWAVQQWVLNRIYNFGLVIKPRPEDITNNENTCTGYWSNPQLEITIAIPES